MHLTRHEERFLPPRRGHFFILPPHSSSRRRRRCRSHISSHEILIAWFDGNTCHAVNIVYLRLVLAQPRRMHRPRRIRTGRSFVRSPRPNDFLSINRETLMYAYLPEPLKRPQHLFFPCYWNIKLNRLHAIFALLTLASLFFPSSSRFFYAVLCTFIISSDGVVDIMLSGDFSFFFE